MPLWRSAMPGLRASLTGSANGCSSAFRCSLSSPRVRQQSPVRPPKSRLVLARLLGRLTSRRCGGRQRRWRTGPPVAGQVLVAQSRHAVDRDTGGRIIE
jgi:hypothetical protein